MDLQHIFVENLKHYRSKRGVSQAKLAELCDLSSGMIGKIEAHLTSPSLQTIERISIALEIDPFLLMIDRSSAGGYQQRVIEDMVSDIRVVLETYQKKQP